MDDVTQQNAALVEQAAASAESLEEQAEQLSMSVDKFNVGDNVRQAVHTPSAPAKYASAPVRMETSQSKKLAPKSSTQTIASDNWEEF
jgi:methyl-accepting chemotaxis protein